MDEIVDKIIKLDKEGQAKINSLEKEKQELSSYIKMMREKLGSDYKKRADEEISSFEAEVIADFNKRLAKIEKETKEKQVTIAKFYDLQKEVWLKELLSFCLEEN